VLTLLKKVWCVGSLLVPIILVSECYNANIYGNLSSNSPVMRLEHTNKLGVTVSAFESWGESESTWYSGL
jgi:hypothetical protein